ncbi:peptidoglycan editing factor PgeF [Aquisalimonas lutea]|uniref:peptidoglycan editing factor PgeF n=1 Tax=Aquisalimonas lutea TaxID=1327750 RepID=UPI0025B48186|nr:peptidoglycan editing factor PgeF [Aquisalimonas lutea]MDN3515991.1 peptidoglycan editing factor PgeF [Aquisalimonas lutea]
MTHPWIEPDWPAPARVQSVSTTRRCGVSAPPYASLNLGRHTRDNPLAVARNQQCLRRAAGLPGRVFWLRQVHGTRVVAAHDSDPEPEADAVWTDRPGLPCGVLTADCLPVLLCDRAGTRVAVAHAGWRGLAGGVLEATVAALDVAPAELVAWMGPAIGPGHFEVGDEVRSAFLDADDGAETAFRASRPGHWYADLYQLGRRRLGRLGVADVSGGGFCTHAEADRFFSYRRDGETGRMGTVIWLAEEGSR